jgi:hypothetical protein
MEIQFLVFLRNSILFSMMLALIYIPNQQRAKRTFLPRLPEIFFFVLAVPPGTRLYLIVL